MIISECQKNLGTLYKYRIDYISYEIGAEKHFFICFVGFVWIISNFYTLVH